MITVQNTTSPGRGRQKDGQGESRVQLVDSAAPDALRANLHFFHREIVQRYGRGGRPLKRPKKVIDDPGADPGVVAFADYNRYGTTLSISLVIVRQDYRGKGLAKRLVNELYGGYPDVKVVQWGRVLNPTAWGLLEYAKEKYPEKTTVGKKFF